MTPSRPASAESRLEDMRSFLARLLGYPEPHGEALSDEFLLQEVTSWVRQGMRAPADPGRAASPVLPRSFAEHDKPQVRTVVTWDAPASRRET